MDLANAHWTAGDYYLRNLWTAIRSVESRLPVELFSITVGNKKPGEFTETSSFPDDSLTWPKSSKVPDIWLKRAQRVHNKYGIWLGPGPSFGSFLKNQSIDCIFSEGDLGLRTVTPLLTWIPDFQHVHLPEMFMLKEIQSRNRSMSEAADHADRVILSSRDALQDYVNFAPKARDKGRVLSFVAQVPTEIYDVNPIQICEIYHLPHRFVYLPNQFWKHKNHDVVIRTLVNLKSKYPEIVVVCTGNTIDYRAPGYFGTLLSQISNLGLRNKLIILGFIPRKHIFLLMRQSLAVLQPSFFEGWSSTVEEAKSLGKQVILSDIPVHREQDPPKARYFDPHDSEDLAVCLVKLFDQVSPGPDLELEATSRQQLADRTRMFGISFLEIVQEVVPHGQNIV